MNYLEQIGILADQQFCFTKNGSVDTAHAMFTHITNIVEGIKENNMTVGVYSQIHHHASQIK